VLPIKDIAVLLKGTYCQVLVLVLKNLTFSSSICSYLSDCKFWKDKPVKQENKNIFATCWLVYFFWNSHGKLFDFFKSQKLPFRIFKFDII